jgi:hypothetical protein
MTNTARPTSGNKCRRNTSDKALFYPDCLGELFGYAPRLKTEYNKVYWGFPNEVVRRIKPKDISNGYGWMR